MPTEEAENTDPTQAEEAKSKATGRKIPIQVWFLKPNSQDPELGFHELLLHHAEVPETRAVATAAIEALLNGAPRQLRKSDDAYSIVPEGTELLGLTVADGTATINFNRRFEESGMGTTGGEPQLAQVVYTLTQFPTVKRVAFEIEGKRVGGERRPFGGHGHILPRFQTRKTWESMLPPIVVEYPYSNATVDRTFTLSGIANVFEANVTWRIVTLDGDVIQEGFTTATCGTGCWGTFETEITYGGQQNRAILEVFESSAEDGSPLHMVDFPLNFRCAPSYCTGGGGVGDGGP